MKKNKNTKGRGAQGDEGGCAGKRNAHGSAGLSAALVTTPEARRDGGLSESQTKSLGLAIPLRTLQRRSGAVAGRPTRKQRNRLREPTGMEIQRRPCKIAAWLAGWLAARWLAGWLLAGWLLADWLLATG